MRYLGLDRFSDQFVSNLSTGTRRVTELACQLALGARVLLLDEPTAGLAQRETEAFAPLIREICAELDAAVLLIEHDMPLVMQVSDRVYCLEAGNVIAEGSPEQVRHDPVVVASYLGTDARSIQRSGTTS
jgi:ABC-type branched-subunit amino acid transport system ATPase component